MILHSGTASQYFIEMFRNVSRCLHTIKTSLELLHYQSLVHLTIRSSFDRVDDADMSGWKLMEGTMGSSCPINIDVLPTQAGLAEVQFKYYPALLKEATNIDAFADHFTSALELLERVLRSTGANLLICGQV
ncbi:hypothetical protein K435DRAFT_797512 [Dendrothele bispora CBS 962.96]|uniref:Uncharacterized protein n=1 Tax=Dendrothele bispora (strain CBS 962.96) TaxID=1314807 RepID=A0A4V4HFT8_DENBC|nr:hypothetical protein K435DRAFT_797512 [Dendrothele bispora CBS 962.96]